MLLTIDGLHKAYQDGATSRVVIKDLQLQLAPGEILAVTGPSGCGKSSLLNMIAGTLAPDGGEISLHLRQQTLRYSSLDETGLAGLRRLHLGYVFQFFNLIPTLSVAENLRLPLVLSGRLHLLDEALARLEPLGLADRAQAMPAQLSGGEQQRVAIARALAHQPLLVLADEPTGNLDADNADQVARLLWQEVARTGASLILATHSQRLAAQAHRVLELGR